MITSRPGAQTPAVDPAVPPLDDDIEAAFDELRGFGPDMDQLVDALHRIAVRPHTVGSTQTHMAVLAGNCPNVADLIAMVVARLGDSRSNPALRALPAPVQAGVRELTADYAALTVENDTYALVSEATAVIDGT